MTNGMRIAITTGCMNRLDHLLRSLSSWTAISEPDHIIVVDWSSEIPLEISLERFHDPRLLVARTENQAHWHHSRCHNLELRLASELQCDAVLRVDSDVVVAPDFFARHPLAERSFYAVDCHSVSPEIDDKRNLCGTLYVRTEHFWAVNGYNERLLLYGFEDEDLYHRLEVSGLAWLRCDLSALDHLTHDDSFRFANLPISQANPHFKRSADLKKCLIAKNRLSTARDPWTSKDRAGDWYIVKKDPRHWTCLSK
jgi:hypothetical protein